MPSVKKFFFWSAIEHLGPTALGFLISIALLRMLEPEAYGLMGMLALFIGLARVFADSGFAASLIQQPNLTADDETSVFALNVVMGVALSSLLCLISPLVAGFYKQPVLMPMLCVMSLSIVLYSFGNVQSALFSRTMQFKKMAGIGIASSFVAGVTGIFMAYLEYGVWSLVGATLADSAVRLILFWILSAWRPHGKVRLDCIRSMWRFSSYLLYCRLIGIAYPNIYNVIIGKFYSTEELGYFNTANNLAMRPVGIVTGIVNRVAFPLFSRGQDDKALLLKQIRELLRTSLLISTVGLTLLVILADPLIPLLLTEKWQRAIPLLRILCCAGVFYPIQGLYLTALQAQGHSNLNARLETIKVVIGVVTVALVFRSGVTALAWSTVGLSLISYFLSAWYNVKLLQYRWRLQAVDILPSLCFCAVAGLAAWWMGTLFPGIDSVVLLLRSGTFVTILGVFIFLFREIFFDDVWKHLIWLFGWVRKSF